MKALITGASIGLGKDIAIYLDKLGYETILVARDKENLERVKELLNNNSKIIIKDLSNIEEVNRLYEETKEDNIDFLVNNAGIGSYGEFTNINIENDINLINLNIVASHMLTKLYLKDMIKKDSGTILNISSLACFSAGPLMSAYYASKSYITTLSMGIAIELKEIKSKVKIFVGCPGPMATNFNNNLGIKFGEKPMSSEDVAKYTIDNCFKKKIIIIPGFKNKIAKFCIKILPMNIILKINYKIQKSKKDDKK